MNKAKSEANCNGSYGEGVQVAAEEAKKAPVEEADADAKWRAFEEAYHKWIVMEEERCPHPGNGVYFEALLKLVPQYIWGLYPREKYGTYAVDLAYKCAWYDKCAWDDKQAEKEEEEEAGEYGGKE